MCFKKKAIQCEIAVRCLFFAFSHNNRCVKEIFFRFPLFQILFKMQCQNFKDFKEVERFGPFVSSIVKHNINIFCQIFEEIVKLNNVSNAKELRFENFIHAACLFLHNAYLRGVDVDAGDNLSFKASQAYTLPSIQGQLNRHHFGSKCLSQHSRLIPTVDQLFNLRAVKKTEKDTTVFENDGVILFGSGNARAIVHRLLYNDKTLRCAQDVADEIASGKQKFVTVLDFANVSISFEGSIALLCAYALSGIHNEHSNALLAVLCQTTFPSRQVPKKTKLLSLTRAKIDKIQPDDSGLATIFYENTTRKTEQLCRINGCVEDTLRHPISRTIVGMPSSLGMTSFDLLMSPGEKHFATDVTELS